jgi:hypothetical protein
MTTMPPAMPTVSIPLVMDFVVVAHALPESERRQWEALASDGEPYNPEHCAATLIALAGPKWALIRPDGQAVAVGGLTYQRAGVWQEWLIATPECWQRYAFSATRQCRSIMQQFLATEAHRIECVSLASKTHAHQWYRVLGFEYEGELRGYGARGEDCKMFAMTNLPPLED